MVGSEMIKQIKPDGDFIGSFLIASPFLGDPDFTRSVVLITNHTHDVRNYNTNKGYSGFKINHVMPSKNQNPVNITYNGGRIGKKVNHLIHSPDVKWDRSRDISKDLCVTNIEKNGIDLSRDQMPKNYIVVYGCTVWMPGQLEDEIRNGTWLPIRGYSELIFEISPINRWYQAYHSISATPECVSMESARC